jgi:hypothetical protein
MLQQVGEAAIFLSNWVFGSQINRRAARNFGKRQLKIHQRNNAGEASEDCLLGFLLLLL